ncbi:GCN5-related N-acetyltransferase [Anaeromyxobacter dehalogenans 2CP-1]|uniref:GCN5-related N-acetyltransferase n=1 Tax=Anaeromyxobacter dehalogenans (strain ATCC BAA-258 / DSM 21875 / 2CP-1) TaxID=455488 RepID=B8JC07_ANAD2|nr:arsinothricin resistance N-acetyltransferase ArsN1 family B [Anaeromyxobacter dehalogenans]ACL63929.1 GCN5-related N-acetyltransferase [Anaeromyxobacter dehalogenans 2CP-1]
MRQIRMATLDDAGDVAEIYGAVVAGTPISFELEPPGPGEMARRMAAVLELAPWLVCEEDGRVDGYVYASRHHDRAAYRWSVDVTVYVRDGRRRGGLGRALYTALLELLRAQGFHAAHAGITLPNAGSVGLHEALGFRPIGVYPRVGWKMGAWHDVGYWQLELRERTRAPGPILAVDALRRSPAWDRALAAGQVLLAR